MSFRTVAVAAVAVLAVVVALVVYLLSSLDGIVKGGIEKYGSEIMGTSVRVGSVEISLKEGKGTIRGLRIKNPDGFPSGDAVSFGEITLGIDIASLSSADPIVVTVVKIAEPSVSWALNEKGKNNISTLQANAKRYAGSGGGEEAPEESSSDEAPTLISIKKLSIAGGKLAADLSALGGPTLESKIAPVYLSNVGGSKGATPGTIGTTIASAFGKSVMNAVAQSQLQGQANKLLGKGLDKIDVDGAKGMLKGLLGQ
jgi:hypothetical protein